MRIRLGLSLLALSVAMPAFAQSQEPPKEQESVAEAARKAREKRKSAAQAKKTFVNDDLASGASAATATSSGYAAQGESGAGAAGASATAGDKSEETPEQKWRKRFAEAREKLSTAEKELAILERELATNQVNYYPDPQKTLQEQTLRTDINDKRAKIEDKKKEIATLRLALDDLERQLRAEGGQPGWARP